MGEGFRVLTRNLLCVCVSTWVHVCVQSSHQPGPCALAPTAPSRLRACAAASCSSDITNSGLCLTKGVSLSFSPLALPWRTHYSQIRTPDHVGKETNSNNNNKKRKLRNLWSEKHCKAASTCLLVHFSMLPEATTTFLDHALEM